MPKISAPTFPNKTVNLEDFGGIPDGIHLNCTAFKDAIRNLAENNGGTLIVPSGVWLTGPIVLESNINLHLAKGAIIVFSTNRELYPLVETVYEGLDTKRCQSPITGRNLNNIAITGEGTINGNGDSWRPLKRGKISETQWNSVIKSGGVMKDPNYWFPNESALLGELLNANTPNGRFSEQDWLSFKDYLRPVMVNFIECNNILLEGVTFENSPSWNIHPLMCTNVIIDGITVRNPMYAQNGDGIDLESCVNSIIINSSFDVGDDGICIKSGKDEDGRKRNRPTENLIVDNCKVFRGHGGFVIGSEMSGSIRNIYVANCQFMGTDIGLRFKAGRGRGGVVENIYINNINMLDIATEPLLFDLYYGVKSEDPIPMADITTPIFRNFFIKNVIAKKVNRAMFVNGLPEMNIRNIHIENVIISSDIGAEISEVDGLFFKNIKIFPQQGPIFMLNNVQNMIVEDLYYPENCQEILTQSGSKTKNLQIMNTELIELQL